MPDDPPARPKAFKSTLKSRLAPEEQEQVRLAAEEGMRLGRKRRLEKADERADGAEKPPAAEEQPSSAAPSTERSSLEPLDVPTAEPSSAGSSGSDAAPTVRQGKRTAAGKVRAAATEQRGDEEPGGEDRATGEPRAEALPQSDSLESSGPLKTTLTSPIDEESAAKLRQAAEEALLEVSVEEAISSREPKPRELAARKGRSRATKGDSTAPGLTRPAAVAVRERPTWPGEEAPLEPTRTMAWRIIAAIVLAAIAALIILRSLQCG